MISIRPATLRYSVVVIFSAGLLLYLPGMCQGALHVFTGRHECYVQPGDVLLAFVGHVRQQLGDVTCGSEVSPYDLIGEELFRYAVHQINADPHVLPNLTVGFVILDSCGVDLSSASTSLYFIPDDETLPSWLVRSDCYETPRHFHVAAVVGPGSSTSAKQIATTMSIAHVPIIATTATSDELSDKNQYEYFMRIGPPDKYQSDAILDILEKFNWTYFALVHNEGSYGENGAKKIERGAHDRGLCVAVSEMIYYDYGEADISRIIQKLEDDGRVRAVVFFGGGSAARNFFRTLEPRLYGHFVFIGSDAIGFSEFGLAAHGALVIHFLTGNLGAYHNYTTTLTPFNNPDDFWLREAWEHESAFNCSWDPEDTSRRPCQPFENETYMDRYSGLSSRRAMELDAVTSMGLGLDILFHENCPGVFLDPSLLRACFSGEKYLAALKKVSFNGSYGEIDFDENGDNIGHYLIKQYSAYENSKGRVVGFWHQENEDVVLDEHSLNWTAFVSLPHERSDVPESVCSYPCPARTYYIVKEMECCWDCRECRDNEILIENRTACQSCPENTWPDADSATMCITIVPDYMSPTDPIGITLLTLTAIGLLATVVTAALVIHFRRTKMMKASSRELMAVILAGILLAFLTVFFIITRPNALTCVASECGFTVSIAAMYAPLLVKTNRVYRIFSAGSKGKIRPMFISSRAQLTIALLAIFVQVVLTVSMTLASPVRAAVRMPVTTDRYSELYCDLPLINFSVMLTYNIALLLSCALFGFLSRKLPENFNEAWFIFMSVATTSFLWLVFFPTYFSTYYAVYQAALLATCLVLNAFITLLCLFIPKIYAIFYVSESTLKFATMTTASAVVPASGTE